METRSNKRARSEKTMPGNYTVSADPGQLSTTYLNAMSKHVSIKLDQALFKLRFHLGAVSKNIW